MKFEYFEGEQRSPEWFKLRLGKVTASRLSDWMAVSKRDGKPLKARKDYEKELVFESTFGVNYEHHVTKAMQDGIDFEPFVREQYAEITKDKVGECGAWFDTLFVASPDGTVGKDGLLEIKVVKENSFVEILGGDIPDKWDYQIQGQLMASGRKWCDFVVANLLTKKFRVARIKADPEFYKAIERALKEDPSDFEFDTTGLHDFTKALPMPIDAPNDHKLDVKF